MTPETTTKFIHQIASVSQPMNRMGNTVTQIPLPGQPPYDLNTTAKS